MSGPDCPHCPRLRAAMQAASDELHASFGRGSREVNGAAGRARRILERALEGESESPARVRRKCLDCRGEKLDALGDECRSCRGYGYILEDE